MNTKGKKIIRLNANENFYGCSVKVRSALRTRLRDLSLYPDPPVKLEKALAKKLNVKEENIVVGGGSVRLIDGLIQSMMDQEDELIFFERSFVAYGQLAAVHHRKVKIAPLTQFCCKLQNIEPLLNEKTRLIFIANPNNPTGTIISHQELRSFLEGLPSRVLVVLDEAYGEYVVDPSFPDSLKLQAEFPNLIVLRTFSKIYGLAGLRIGYGIMHHEHAFPLSRNRIPFFFNSLSETAALIALEDQTYVHRCRKRNAVEREKMYHLFRHAGLNVMASQGNFLFLYFRSEEEKDEWYLRFTAEGLNICDLKVFGQDRSLRIGVGDRSVLQALKKIIRAADINLRSERK